MAKKTIEGNRIVYSTNPNINLEEDNSDEEETLLPAEQKNKNTSR